MVNFRLLVCVFFWMIVAHASQETQLLRCRFIAQLVEHSAIDENKNKFGNIPGTNPKSVEVHGIPMVFFDYEFDYQPRTIDNNFPLYTATLKNNKEICVNFTDIPQSFNADRCKEKNKKNYSLSISFFDSFLPNDESKNSSLGKCLLFKDLQRINKRFMVAYAPPSSFYVIINKEDSQTPNNSIPFSTEPKTLLSASKNNTQSPTSLDRNFSFSLPSYILGFFSCGILIALTFHLRTK